jgi:hypothetical protein
LIITLGFKEIPVIPGYGQNGTAIFNVLANSTSSFIATMTNYLNFTPDPSQIENVFINVSVQTIELQLSQLPPVTEYGVITGFIATALNITSHRVGSTFLRLGIYYYYYYY